MKLPDPPSFEESLEAIPPEVRFGFNEGWRRGIRAGYRLGLRDGNPGRKKSTAKSEAARANGAKGGRPKKKSG